jgi:DNA helicase-2/ATP-dependent DNA helicase PcrA
LIDVDIFGEVDKSRLRQTKPKSGTPPAIGKPNETQLRKLRKLKPELSKPIGNTNVVDPNLSEGAKVNHTRFGKGVVLKIEGVGNDKKAEIKFDQGDTKKLLLRFAKLEVLATD